ncbi:MAG: DUF2607 family protein [Gammaproteobacteria bacterium]|nr:DUF2607 family protein [Gammaproteobacteria bacterium]
MQQTRPFSPPLLALILSVMLLLAQIYLVNHQIDHIVMAEDHACLICELANHQGNGMALSTLAAPALLTSANPAVATTEFFLSAFTLHYRSRAPPPPLTET